ncbi:OLC1v1023666C1 [Oldenlandia corymbosa var. corymbosa]|uniref:OLC1v1023666C1 n=1 Tax=Oldenlandia corymbosa var. corymbosa TaxID=529605 RepID=A0AAV1C0G8_OLDCO|nr:OLC1v1023666C1 [Oldenlandia corymbosa var. corymbosa]
MSDRHFVEISGRQISASLRMLKLEMSTDILLIFNLYVKALAHQPTYPLPKFDKLKILDVRLLCFTTDYDRRNIIVELLINSPYLESLIVSQVERGVCSCTGRGSKIENHLEDVPNLAAGNILAHLKTVRFDNFHRWVKEIYLVKFLLEHASVLEEFIIHLKHRPVVDEKLLELKLHSSKPIGPSPSFTSSRSAISTELPTPPLFLFNFMRKRGKASSRLANSFTVYVVNDTSRRHAVQNSGFFLKRKDGTTLQTFMITLAVCLYTTSETIKTKAKFIVKKNGSQDFYSERAAHKKAVEKNGYSSMNSQAVDELGNEAKGKGRVIPRSVKIRSENGDRMNEDDDSDRSSKHDPSRFELDSVFGPSLFDTNSLTKLYLLEISGGRNMNFTYRGMDCRARLILEKFSASLNVLDLSMEVIVVFDKLNNVIIRLPCTAGGYMCDVVLEFLKNAPNLEALVILQEESKDPFSYLPIYGIFSSSWTRVPPHITGYTTLNGFGCGFGLAFGLIGGTGFGAGVPGLQLGLGVGAGCGIGLGFGYGVGRGIAYDHSRRYSNIDGFKFPSPSTLFPNQDEIGGLIDELVVNTKKLVDATAREMDKWRRP